MEASMMKMPGKRLLLPKAISPKTNSMSLKNPITNEISQNRLNNSKGKVILRTVYPEANTGKKILQTKPKLIADAELKSLIPARSQQAYESPLANICIESEKAKSEQDYCTNISNENNTDNIVKEYYNDIDEERHQSVESQTGQQSLNFCPERFDPFLSDSNTKEILNISSLELVQDIESLNIVSKQEGSEINEIIAEGFLPIATSNTESKMDDSHIWGATWGADSLFNDVMPEMEIVNPLTVEGKSFANEQMDSESDTSSSKIENQPLNMPQPSSNEDMVSLIDMKDAFEGLDEDFVASVLDEIENNVEGNTNAENVPATKDLLEMVIDDSIGMETVAQVLNEPYTTLNLQDIGTITENPTTICVSPNTQEEDSNDVTSTVVTVPKRKVGRPCKERAEVKTPKRRGRPTKEHSNVDILTADHHNYSNKIKSTVEKRYRRMRDLNNVASQRCRLKRKQKMHSALEELKNEEEKNEQLSIKVRVLEDQVRDLKKLFINKISNPSIVAPTTVKPVAMCETSMVWNSEQLERFVDNVANKHLGN